MSLAVYKSFENGNYILEENIKLVTNFICGNLISWSPNRSYYQAQYNYATKLYHVFRWRKKRGFRPTAKIEETICNDELVNFLADEKHKNCIWSTVSNIFCVLHYFMKCMTIFLRGTICQSFFYFKLYFVVIESVTFWPNKKIKPMRWSFFTSIVRVRLLFSMCN